MSKDPADLHMELMLLRRDFEACRACSLQRSDHIEELIKALRAEVVGLGKAAEAVARETKAEMMQAIGELRDLLGGNGHA